MCIFTSHASKHDTPAGHLAAHCIPSLCKITLKEHLQQVGQKLKKLPVTACACHASLKNYRNEEFEAVLHNFKKISIILSLEQENKRTVKQDMKHLTSLLEFMYAYVTTKYPKPNTYVHVTLEKKQITAEFSYLSLHDLTESKYALAYYITLIRLLDFYHYFPGSQVTALIHKRILTMEEDLSYFVSTHLMEHIHRHSLYLVSLLSLLSQQYRYFNDKIIQKLTQLIQAHKKVAFICYTIHNLKTASLKDNTQQASSSSTSSTSTSTTS